MSLALDRDARDRRARAVASHGEGTRVRRVKADVARETLAAWDVLALVALVDWAVTLVRVMVRASLRGALGGRGVWERVGTRAAESEAVVAGALVTGWSSGLGRASAIELARRGYAIVVPYRLGGLDAANALAEECRREAPEARVELTGPLDLASERDVARMSFAALRIRGLDVRVLVHCAAVFGEDGGTSSESSSFDVNFRNAALLTERFVKEMTETSNSRLRVVFLGSFVHRCVTARLLGFEAFRRWLKPTHANRRREHSSAIDYMWSKVAISAYAVAKNEAWFETYGGRVTAVLLDPGLVDTRLVRHWPAWLQVLYRTFGQASGLMKTPASAARGVAIAVGLEVTSAECPQIFGANGAPIGDSFWTRDARVRDLVKCSAAA